MSDVFCYATRFFTSVLIVKQVEDLRSRGCEPYAYKWDKSHSTSDLQELYKNLRNGEEVEEDQVSVAGRIVARRDFGKKLSFLILRDDSGTIQVFRHSLYSIDHASFCSCALALKISMIGSFFILFFN